MDTFPSLMFSSIPCVAIFFHSLIFCKSEIIVNDPHTNTGALQSLTHHKCSWLTWLITDQIECVLKLIFDTLSPTSCITRLSKVEVQSEDFTPSQHYVEFS